MSAFFIIYAGQTTGFTKTYDDYLTNLKGTVFSNYDPTEKRLDRSSVLSNIID